MDYARYRALVKAAENGSIKEAESLVGYIKTPYDWATHVEETPLIMAVKNNNMEMVSWLIEHGASVNEKGHRPETPISLAKYARPETRKALGIND